MRREHLHSRIPYAAGEDGRGPAGGTAPLADPQHRPDEGTHHVVAERVRLDRGDRQAPLGAVPAQLQQLPDRGDFAAFCRRREGATTIRTLLALDVVRSGGLITVAASADAFCHSMVRSLVGALLAVGEGRRLPEWPGTLLTRTERASEVPVAPAGGLTLVGVDYPSDDELAARVGVTRARRA